MTVMFVFSHGLQAESPDLTQKEAQEYTAEAPLPKGWPKPGPYGVVTEKQFPSYRAAYTDGKSQNFAFWRLFRHIKKNEIPMTSPVEMEMKQNGEKLSMKSMGFMYQHTKVGEAGADGSKIEVRDVPAMKTLAYTWMGGKNSANLRIAKQALEAELVKRRLKGKDFRVMGYNGPGVPTAKKTWEMLVVVD